MAVIADPTGAAVALSWEPRGVIGAELVQRAGAPVERPRDHRVDARP